MALIIVVDDDAPIRLVLREILERMGHTVLEAGDGEACFRHFTSVCPNLVITDLFMPGKEGLETIFELKDNWPDIRIIAMSGGRPGAPDYLKLAQGLGADRILHKPLSAGLVFRAVNALLPEFLLS